MIPLLLKIIIPQIGVNGIGIEQLTSNSITLLMLPSSGATSYTARLFDQTYHFLFHEFIISYFLFLI